MVRGLIAVVRGIFDNRELSKSCSWITTQEPQETSRSNPELHKGARKADSVRDVKHARCESTLFLVTILSLNADNIAPIPGERDFDQ